MDLGTAQWLASDDGRAALAAACRLDAEAHAAAASGRGRVDPLALATAVRRALPGLDPGRAAELLTQARLRRRARPRLGDVVDLLLLTEDGAEQATRTVVADLRAGALLASGATHVADLGCGLGLDLLAFARSGLRVTGVERDPVVAALARVNAAALGLDGLVEVLDGDVTDADVLDRALAAADAAYVDPARRDTGRRTQGRAARVADAEDWSPPWSWVEGVADRVPRLLAKVAPGVPRDLAPDGGCTTWTSVDGHLVEAEVAWPLAAAPYDGAVRQARVVRDGAVHLLASRQESDPAPPPVGPVGRWLHEPDDAVIRAGLVADVAALVEGRLLDEHVAYVTSDDDVEVPLATRFEVRHALPFDIAAVRSLLVAEGVGEVVVKKRATSLEPERIVRELALPRAGGRAVLLLARVGDGVDAFVCDWPPAWS